RLRRRRARGARGPKDVRNARRGPPRPLRRGAARAARGPHRARCRSSARGQYVQRLAPGPRWRVAAGGARPRGRRRLDRNRVRLRQDRAVLRPRGDRCPRERQQGRLAHQLRRAAHGRRPRGPAGGTGGCARGRTRAATRRGPAVRTVVAMSGGVDSSVAAGILAAAGRDLIGVSLQTYDHAPDRGFGRCCSPDDFRDARRVAGKLGFPYYVFDEEESFARAVIDPFIEAYRAGRTPSPCVLCNSEVKFGSLLEKARRLGAGSVATGHYARVRREGERSLLLRGRDPDKDQSYFLFGLDQEQLACAEFPVGELTKDE